MKTIALLCLTFLTTVACYGDNMLLPTGEHRFDAAIAIDGLTAPAAVYIDDAGMLHVQCEVDIDCFAAQGYFHAADRFFQMDLRRRLARGRLSEVVGNLALDIDIQQRLIFATRDGKPLEEVLLANSDSTTVAALEAYTRGVNSWLADLRANENNARTAAERHFPAVESDIITDWEVLDSVASILLLVDDLTNDSGRDIQLGQIFAALGPQAAGDIFTRRPPSPSTIAPKPSTTLIASAPASASQIPRAHLDRLRTAQSLFAEAMGKNWRVRHNDGGQRRLQDSGARGSNNWVVGPSLANGKTLLANDPHLTLSNPSIWYLVHLDSKTEGKGNLHVAGVSFPGLPGIIIGHNEDIAWGVTNTAADFVDVYMETVTTDDQGVVFNGQNVPFIAREETFKPAGASSEVTRTLLYVPHHGPVISGPDTTNKTALSMRWTLHDADSDLNFLNALFVATSVDEANAAVRNVTTAGQNFVIIDRQGNYGWFPYNRWRERPFAATYPPFMPLPGTGEAEWGDVIPYDALPQLRNPEKGYIATANNDFTGAMADGDATNDNQSVIQNYIDLGYRHERIAQRIEAESSHDLASMQSIQSDVHSLFGERVVPEILAAAGRITSLSAAAQNVVTTLSNWDFACPTGLDGSNAGTSSPVSDTAIIASATGCTAFHVLWPRLRQLTFGDELEAASVEIMPYHNSTILALTEADPFSGRDYFDNVATTGVTESKDDIIAAALESAATFLTDKLGAEPNDWLWGRLHTVTLRADLFSSFGVDNFDSATFANDGGFNTVDVAAPRQSDEDEYFHASGASMRLACEASAAAPVRCTIELPGGQRHHRSDPFYLSLFDQWLENQPHSLIFSITRAEQNAARSIRLFAE